MPPRFRRTRPIPFTSLLLGLLLLSGCQSCTTTDEPPPAATAEQTPPPRTLAADYLRYAYQGALLSSDHPLNDSLSALMTGRISGRTLTVIDTFMIESVEVQEEPHTVHVRFPRSVQIQSATWATSPAATDEERRIRIRQAKVSAAPHVVGWPAFQHHLREVAPAAADTVLRQVAIKLKQSRSDEGR